MNKNKTPKILKQVHVQTFIREGEVVKGYVRLQDVRLPQLKKDREKINHRSIEELNTYAKKLNNEGYYDEKEFQEEILGLYSDGMHGISDPGLSRDINRLHDTYKTMNDIISSYYDGLELDNVQDKLTDPEYLKDLHEMNKKLEKRFNNEFGLETERVNPFIFRTKLNLPDNVNIGKVLQYRDLENTFVNFMNKLDVGVSKGGPMGIVSEKPLKIIDSLIRGSNISQQKLEKTLIPAVLLSELFQPKHIYDPNNPEHVKPNNLEDIITPIDNLLQMRFRSEYGLPEGLKNYSATLGDPDNDIRKPFLKYLNELTKISGYEEHIKNNVDMEKSRQHLSNQMKGLKADEIVPNFIYMMENGTTFNHYGNNEFKEKFIKFTKIVSQKMFDAWNSRHDYVYVSNNPMDFVTMSPQASITSCQSITERGGGIEVDKYNVNLVNSINLNNTNDFLMYTLDANPARKNTKINRISLHNNESNNTFESYENQKIYNKNSEIDQLDEYLYEGDGKKILKKMKSIDYPSDVISDFFGPQHPLEEVLNDHKSYLNDVNKELDNTIKKLTNKKHTDFNSTDEIEAYAQEIIDGFDNKLNKMSREHYNVSKVKDNILDIFVDYLHSSIKKTSSTRDSMLYGSEFQKLAITSSVLTDTVDSYCEQYDRNINNYLAEIEYSSSILEDEVDTWEHDIKEKQYNKV